MNNLNLKTIIICLFFIGKLNAQTDVTAEWLRHTCGYTDGEHLLGGDVWGDAVCADDFGNSYNSGSSVGYWFVMDTVIDMDINRFYINKYNSSGERIWTVGASGTTFSSIMTSSRMKCDSLGNVYVCGTFSVEDSAYLAPNWYPIGSGYVAKYDSDGNNIWCRYVPRTGTTSISFNDMDLVNGKIYLCGIMGYGSQSFGSFDFNSTESQNGIIAKLDLDGNILAAEQLDINSVNEIHGIEVSKNTNEIYLVGQFIFSNLTVDDIVLDHTEFATNSFIIKMDNSLNAIWAKKCDTYLRIDAAVGSSVQCLTNIEIDKFENIYVTANGNGDSTVIGDLRFDHQISLSGAYAQDIYLAKIDSAGNEIWLRHGGSLGMDVVTDIATDEWGNSVMSVYSSLDGGGVGLIFGTDTIPQWHGGLVKYDPFGNLIYTEKLQEARTLNALAMSKDSVFYGTGNGFNPGHPYLNLSITSCEDDVNGYYNPPYKMVMVKLFDNSGDFTASIDDEQNIQYSIKIFPNPANNEINVNFETTTSDLKEVVIYDLSGKELIKTFTTENVILDVDALANGIYIIKVSENEKYYISKFVKN